MRRISILSGLFIVLFFSIHLSAIADANPGIVMNEVQIEGTSVNDEFIELRNISTSTVSLSGWKLQKRTSGGSVSTIKSFGNECIALHSDGYLLWSNSAGIFAPLADFTTTQSLAKTNSFELVDGNGVIRDSLTWGDDALKGKSLKRDIGTLSWSVSDSPSPEGGDALCPAPAEDPDTPPASGTSSIRINELFPNPTGTESEWIELYNFGSSDVDLSKGWKLRDKTTTYDFSKESDPLILSDGYKIIEQKDSAIKLNDTGEETLTLSAPDGSVVDTTSYTKTKEGASLSFDGASFRWSPFLTPGKENRFGEKPETKKTSIPEEGYKDVPLEFTASGSDGQEFLWNFGDGKTSRKQAASHTYRKTGEYNGTLTITDEDGITESVKEFTIDIGDFPKVKLSITAIAPNPKGADTGAEWISVKNGGKKKLDLLGFGIATGSSRKKLSNHPVSESLVIKAGKEKQITSASASFTLPNENGYVEIRRPDGKMLVGRSYKKSGGVKDDEVWRKIAGKSWEWVKEPSKNPKKEIAEAAPEKSPDEEPGTTATESVPVTTPETEAPKKEITLEDLSPEQLALLEARVEERLRGQIIAELEASGKLAVAPEADTDTDSGAVLGTSDEKPTAPLLQELNALLGKMLFGN